MGNVRVYELAKEAGIDSKAMVSKLNEMGYEIKSHSSSLEEKEANEIRIKLGLVSTKVEKKRIQTKGKTTIIRRRTKVKKEVPPVIEEPIVPEEVEEDMPVAAPVESSVEKEEKLSEAVHKPQESEEIAAPQQTKVDRSEEIVSAVDEEEKPVQEEVKPSEPVTGDVSTEEEVLEQEVVVKAEEDESAQKDQPEKKAEPEPIVQPRKGIARIIKRAAIKIPVEEKPAPRPKKTRKPKPAKTVATAKPAAEPKSEDAPKGKKGKRYVKFQPESSERDRGRKTTTKRKSRIVVDVDDVDELGGTLPASLRVSRSQRSGGKKGKKAEVQPQVSVSKAIKRRIKVTDFIAVGELAHRMGIKANEVIGKLMGLGIMATVNQALDVETAILIADEFGYEVEQGVTEEQVFEDLETEESGGEEVPRPPVVTVMGHVDHGKTSILDAIRKTDVAAGEAGGITQHIGAHYVRSAQGDVVFLDTPGHEAFTEMRSRGAKVTDVVVLVVAADDGVMEQTKEAINHAKAAEVPIVVAVNKIDKEDADPLRVMRELSEFGVVPEEWGGDTIFCQTSAKQNQGIDELLEQILLQAEVQELKADPNRKARGHVVEAQLHKGRGATATVLVQHGTLHVGDAFVVGLYHGKVRALFSDKGKTIKEAGPAIPVEVQGLSGVPQAGDEFIVVADEKLAKNISNDRLMRSREVELASSSKISLDNLFEKLKEGEIKELLVVLRADVQGTLEAFISSVAKLNTDEVRVKVIHQGTGTITESDVLLANASNAIIIGFNVRPNAKVTELAQKEKVDIRFYDVIYHALEDIRDAMEGMLDSTFEEKVIGTVEVRDTFTVPKVGTIAGSYVTDGKIERNANVRLLREGVVIYTGKISSLRRFKDDAREVSSGYECGVGIENYNNIKVGDTMEVFVLKEVAGVL